MFFKNKKFFNRIFFFGPLKKVTYCGWLETQVTDHYSLVTYFQQRLILDLRDGDLR